MLESLTGHQTLKEIVFELYKIEDALKYWHEKTMDVENEMKIHSPSSEAVAKKLEESHKAIIDMEEKIKHIKYSLKSRIFVEQSVPGIP